MQEGILTSFPSYAIISKRFALVAQSVERRLGKAEAGGSSPLGSLNKINA